MNALLALGFCLLLTAACADAQDPATGSISGVVVGPDGPLAGALVRQQATENMVLTDGEGRFELRDLPREGTLKITAWVEGYFVGWVDDALAKAQPVEIVLKPYYTYDNPAYDWFSLEGEMGSISCSHCMPCYEEWLDDAHSQSAVNPRFLTTYSGIDLYGNQSPLTRFIYIRDYGRFPLRPQPGQPYYGPGYRLDFPESAGNCASCHVPAQAAHPGMAYAADPTLAQGIEQEGVFCEFCHKIGGVQLDPVSGLPAPNMPGVLSLQLHRPQGEDQLFFGSFDDVTRRVSYLPLEQESAFCAPCHYGVFWDTVIYNSYGEWLESTYSDADQGKTCQACHMPTVDYDYFVYPEQGGLIRDASRIRSHRMLGARDLDFLKAGLTFDAAASLAGDRLFVDVELVNDNTGHNYPTDSPLRQLLLIVEAIDADGDTLELLAGSRLPGWAGEGRPQDGYYAGLPGMAYALVLEEQWTGVSPTAAYWNPVRVVADTRLRPFEADRSRFEFDSQGVGPVQVRVRLIFRRALIELSDQKAWEREDLTLYDQFLFPGD